VSAEELPRSRLGPKTRLKEERDSVILETSASGAVRVRIHGEVDLSRFDELDQVLASADADCRALEIDLGAVSFMDSQGLRLLLRARDRAAGNGHRLLIVDPTPFVQRLLQLSGLSGTFEIGRGAGVAVRCPCCLGCLSMTDPSGEELRPGDGWCPECRWVVLVEVLAGGDWPVECPTHGRPIAELPAHET
jgi:anti-anti-sigma factor